MFFPTTLEKLIQFATAHANIPDLISAVIEHVAARIETEYGRLKPLQIERDSFSQLKFKILREIDRGKHIRESKEKTFEECVCLTHLHLSVCRVETYQEKWLAMKREEQLKEKTDIPKNANKYNSSLNASKISNFPAFKAEAVPPFMKQNPPSTSISTPINTFGTSQNKVGTIQQRTCYDNNRKFSFYQARFSKELSKKRETPSTLISDERVNKRMKFPQVNQGIKQSQTGSLQNLPKVWETPNPGSFNQLVGNSLTPFANQIGSNFNRAMNNNTRIPLANSVPVNTVIKPPLISNKTTVSPFISQNKGKFNSAVNNYFAGASKKFREAFNVQNVTGSNIQQKLSQNNVKPWINQGKTSNMNQTPSNSASINTNLLNTNTNSTLTNQTKNYFNPPNQRKSNFQNTNNKNIIPKSIPNNEVNQSFFFPPNQFNPYLFRPPPNVNNIPPKSIPNQFNPLLFTKTQKNTNNIPTNFKNSQGANRMVSPFLNNKSNIQQLNPIAFTAPPPICPPMMNIHSTSQRFNMPPTNPFNHLNNLQKK